MTRLAPIKPGEPVTRMVLPFRLMGVLLILIVLMGYCNVWLRFSLLRGLSVGVAVPVVSVSAEDISCVDFFFDIVKGRIIAVGDDAAAHFLEFFKIIDNLTTEESGAIFKRWLIDHNSGALCLDPLHDSLD